MNTATQRTDTTPKKETDPLHVPASHCHLKSPMSGTEKLENYTQSHKLKNFTLLHALHSPDALNTEYHIMVKASCRTIMNNIASWC